MFEIAVRGVRNNAGRYIATIVAIITGVAFYAATGFISDGVIDSLEGNTNRQYGAVEVAVVPDASSGRVGVGPSLLLSGEAVDSIRAVDGINSGAGVFTGLVSLAGPDGSVKAKAATGRLWMEDEKLNPLEITEGRAPEAPDEIALDRELIKRASAKVGDSITVLTQSGPHSAKVVGTTRFGHEAALDQSGTVSIPESAIFDWLNGGSRGYSEYYLRGSGDPRQLAEAVGEVTPPGFKAVDGPTFLEDKRSETGAFGNFMKQGLRAFAVLALFVGAFVIYNTFSVIVAQRQRELAVLAAIGATPKQVKRSLRYEGLVVGLVGSIAGVVIGIGLAQVILIVMKTFGVALPGSGSLVILAPNVISAVVIGTIITYLSVTIPARRAARIEPIEALRDAQADTKGASRSRGIASLVFLVLGLVAVSVGGAVMSIAGGIICLLVSVLVAGPYVAIWGSAIFRKLFSVFGLEGRLAVDNSVRNPNRTATTVNALLIGVFLVTFVTIAGTSLKNYVVGELAKMQSADFVMVSTSGPIDPGTVAGVAGVEGVKSVMAFRQETLSVDGSPSTLSSADISELVEVSGVKAEKGSLDDLADGTIAVAADAENPREIGDTVQVAATDGTSASLRVVAVLEGGMDAALVGNLVSSQTLDSLVGDTPPKAAFVDAESGDQSKILTAIQEALVQRPDIIVVPGNLMGRLVSGVFDFLINAVNGLLAMSVLVALIGIVNTLSLSILERRRELGLLRIMGMIDRRVRRMVRLESTLIALLGTVTGILLGTVSGLAVIAAINRMSEASISFGLPLGSLAVILALGILAGVLASLLPARRSTRLEVLDAIQAT